MTRNRFGGLALLTIALHLSTSAQAANLLLNPEPIEQQDMGLVAPAVSHANAYLDLGLGTYTEPSQTWFGAAGSFAMPVSHAFGAQGDVSLNWVDGYGSFGGALHAFTRDPDQYLVGLTAGFVTDGHASIVAIGPEAELYLGNVSLEGWAGWARSDYDGTEVESGGFFIGDVAMYLNDDFRVSIGGRSIMGRNALRLATEYQLSDAGLPFSLTGEVMAYDDDRFSAKIGIRGYLGGDDGKSLIARHREDNVRNRALDLFAGGGGPMCADGYEWVHVYGDLWDCELVQ